MALPPNFPTSPYEVLDPDQRWVPDVTNQHQLLPPLVGKIRAAVKQWRDQNYKGATTTSRALLTHWFDTHHLLPQAHGSMLPMRYYFAQREAVETIIWLFDAAKVKDKYDLFRFDSSGVVSAGMFTENWRRFVIKMATGSGKTKVMSLVLAWSFFHKLYEEDSALARNFLIIAPNIIVLDRLRTDFDGNRIFFQDPILPDNGYEGQNWRDDFQLTLHIQDDARVIRPTGNIFLTNIHRVYSGRDPEPSIDDDNLEDYFLGKRPKGATTDSKVNLSDIVRDIDELIVLNDEAHHIHDERLAWFKSIQDIHHHLVQKGKALALQIDVTATPKHNNGTIFVQTVADYPLVEAISQNVVKHPVLPDGPSRAKLKEAQSSKFTEKYADYIGLGVEEWRKVYEQHQKLGKKAILFIMTDDTRNCDEVAKYLQGTYPEFQDAVLTIHTKNNGEISDTSQNKGELERLRKEANRIDDFDSPYKAIVSVMMLKEGWDVRNVTTIVGLRAYAAKSNILPEQTLGRGLRRMYPDQDAKEKVSVVGTSAFMEFVELIRAEGVVLETSAMGAGTKPKTPLIIEIDKENKKKDLDELDIEIPVLTPRIYREYKNLSGLDVAKFKFQKVAYLQFSEEEKREIIFKDVTTGDVSHTTQLDGIGASNYQSAIGWFVRQIMRDLRLVSGYEVLYEKVKPFVQSHLFGQVVELEDSNTLRNLSETTATRTIMAVFKQEINNLTIQDRGEAEIQNHIKLSKVRPFVVKDREYVLPKKSPFNKIIGDSHLELIFAKFLDDCDDIISYAKNYFAVNFKLDYVNANGDISNYYPDFIVKKTNHEIYIIETKGAEYLDDPLKAERLKQWCRDINQLQKDVVHDFVYVDEENFEKYQPSSFNQLIQQFTKYKS